MVTAAAALHKIVVNGEPATTSATTLADLVAERHGDQRSVATALNGAFVAAVARTATELNDGDVVEIVSARQGG